MTFVPPGIFEKLVDAVTSEILHVVEVQPVPLSLPWHLSTRLRGIYIRYSNGISETNAFDKRWRAWGFRHQLDLPQARGP